jgi:DegV family protein with EDD domain
MSSKIRIVVDSAADFVNPNLLDRYRVAVVPQTIHFGQEHYLEGVEMDAESFFKRLSREGDDTELLQITAPTVEQFAQAYTQLSQHYDKIISLHSSKHLTGAFENAQAAAKLVAGRCQVEVLDSQTTSLGLGLLVEVAARTAEQNPSLEDALRVLRGAIGRVYGIFYVDTLDYIQKRGLLGEAQSILGAMLNIKPFLTIEEGRLQTMEKARTRSQAVDKLVEFVAEFEHLDRLVILQNSPFTTEAVRLLQERLAAEYGKRNYPVALYGPTLASYLGPDATGVVILERSHD